MNSVKISAGAPRHTYLSEFSELLFSGEEHAALREDLREIDRPTFNGTLFDDITSFVEMRIHQVLKLEGC
jgi:hypothetical protein